MPDISFLETFYDLHTGLCNTVILILVFAGMGRLAFWRDHEGLKVGGSLAIGLGLLLTVALMKWADAEGRTILELGPWAAIILLEAIVILGWAAFWKSTKS